MNDPQIIARGRQALLMSIILPRVDFLIEEAARAKVGAPGLLELREWAQYNLEENAAAAEQGLKR